MTAFHYQASDLVRPQARAGLRRVLSYRGNLAAEDGFAVLDALDAALDALEESQRATAAWRIEARYQLEIQGRETTPPDTGPGGTTTPPLPVPPRRGRRVRGVDVDGLPGAPPFTTIPPR